MLLSYCSELSKFIEDELLREGATGGESSRLLHAVPSRKVAVLAHCCAGVWRVWKTLEHMMSCSSEPKVISAFRRLQEKAARRSPLCTGRRACYTLFCIAVVVIVISGFTQKDAAIQHSKGECR